MKRGFTLVEMIVSIALVLILILGVNAVFRIATDSVGAGQALGDNTRSNRAVQTVIYNDFQQSVIRSTDSPAFIIRSQVKSAFLDKADELADRDYVQGGTVAAVETALHTVDLNGNNVEGETIEPGEVIASNDLSRRNHRIDSMSFFARYLYPRQTGDDGQFTADMSANEAWIWYGILNQPRDLENAAVNSSPPGWWNGSTTPPTVMTPTPGTGVVNNPNNFYARQFGLGRVAVLLREPSPDGTIRDKANFPQFYHYRPAGEPAASTSPLSPLAVAWEGAAPNYPGMNMVDARFDLAGTSIDVFRRMLGPGAGTIRSGPALWYDETHMGFAFSAYPFPTNPLSSYGAARTAPWLVGGCIQFIVEYAGDFLTQDAAGVITGNYTTGPTDGEVDWIPLTTGINPPRGVRWYGMPRDVTGEGAFNARDVLPLRDFMGPVEPAHEHFTAGFPTAPAQYPNIQPSHVYTAAWAPIYPDPVTPTNTAADLPVPPKPLMLRITMTIDDQQGRLPQGQTYEYIVELP